MTIVRASMLLLLVACLLLPLGGCTSSTEVYTGESPERVWTAMITAAETPDEPDWFVLDNQVWVDPANDRIELYRHVRRTLHRPGAKPLDEEHEWRFQMALERTEPPAVSIVARNPAIPAKAWRAANRLYDDIWRILGRPVPERVE